MDRDLICENLSVGENGHLLFAGQDTVKLAAQYGTPLYLMDEDLIRKRCRTYLAAVHQVFGSTSKVYYASKAAAFRQMYRIMNEENMFVDVVSPGEIYTALAAGFPLERACFHSNNKTDEDIIYAMEHNIGCFVVDNLEELFAVDRHAAARGRKQPVMLRITPGIDPHTYEAIATGKVDSKFGFAIETGQGEEAARIALSLPNITLQGFHSHVGSQVFDSDVFIRTADVMLTFVAHIYRTYGYMAQELDLGGGYGVRYIASDPDLDIAASISEVGEFMQGKVVELGIPMPAVSFEPGRSIVADAGMTLYTAGSIKSIPGYRNYVSVDGGMTDNIRFALYGADYTVLPADNMLAPRDMRFSVVGRCCESGDIIQENIPLPAATHRGNIIACLTTGAYHYSMASHYNRIPNPAVVMLREGTSYVAVRRETNADLCRLDE